MWGDSSDRGVQMDYQPWTSHVIVHTDGASRGNPGPASLGVQVVDRDGELICEYGEKLGDQTNNYAEYMAVVRALEMAVQHGVQSLELKSDSQLLVRQLLGQYKVKAEGLKDLYHACLSLKREIPQVEFIHVRREENKRADEIANRVLDGLPL